MPLKDFIIWVYCWTDENMTEALGNTTLRSRGFEPTLSDMKVIMMEIVSKFLSYDGDNRVWAYFKTHWLPWFPKLTSRSSFAKQASNLWHVKQRLQERLDQKSRMHAQCYIVDGFPITTAHFKRANKSNHFKGGVGDGFWCR